MKVLILSRPDSEYNRLVVEFQRDFERAQPGRSLEIINSDSRQGGNIAQLYDVVQLPAIIAMSNDGQLLQLWQGTPLPLTNEVAYYAST